MNNKQAKVERLRASLEHREGDRVPVSDSFWSGFLKKAKNMWGGDFDPYRQFDLDYIIVNPNMDPVIQDFEIVSQKGEDITVKTGFGATIMRRADLPMPYFADFSVKEPEEMANFRFDSPRDPRRLYRAGEDQLNCLGDSLLLGGVPSWSDRVDAYCGDMPVFGGICEGYEYLWRCIGSENSLVWMAEEPEMLEAFVSGIGDFLVELTEYQIEESKGRIDGMYVWGDIAYKNGLLFSPGHWRRIFKPVTQRIIKTCRDAGLMVIYHGCGNASRLYGDLAEIGVQGYNPVEVKAGLDIVELKEEFGDLLAYVGNIDVRVLESGDRKAIKKELLYKLQAARGGGWICQSDHSVSSGVDPESYAYLVSLLREYGSYPLDLKRIRDELAAL